MFALSRYLSFPPSVRQSILRTTPNYLAFCKLRTLLTLAIETSCDDTAVALVETYKRPNEQQRTFLHFHKKITSNNSVFRGVHPLVALESHQESLADLINEAILELPTTKKFRPNDNEEDDSGLSQTSEFDSVEIRRQRPDFISVTRGPGMRSNLSTGIDTAKGLAVAWQIPLVGVHHMQAHALTPRFVAALQRAEKEPLEPEFPLLSVLVSGGHTLLVLSESLTEHKVLASTTDISIGQCLDKVARVVLPRSYLEPAEGTMYGALLERFAFADNSSEDAPEYRNATGTPANVIRAGLQFGGYRAYQSPYVMEYSTAREYISSGSSEESTRKYHYGTFDDPVKGTSKPVTEWGWGFSPPLTNSAGGTKQKSMEFSFSGLTSAVERATRFSFDKETGKITNAEKNADTIGLEERRTMAREAMRAAFEHLGSRIILALQEIKSTNPRLASKLTAIVVSGGVASNGYLKHLLARTLTAHGYHNTRMYFPPPSLCTDNAAMIAWAGIEMFEAGYKDSYSIRAIRKWPLENLVRNIPKDA